MGTRRQDVLQELLENRNGLRGVPAEVRSAVQSPTEWRLLVRHLYIDLGGPRLVGFTNGQVHQILWGEVPPSVEFFSALISALLLQAQVRQATGAYYTGSASLYTADVGSTAGAAVGSVDRKQADARLTDDATLVTTGVSPTSEAAGPGDPAPGGSPMALGPPDPDKAATVSAFMQDLTLVKQWSGSTLRQLEARAASEGTWLPRATTADMLKRDRLPRADVLWAFTTACGLPLADRERWEAARERLASGGRDPVRREECRR